MMLDHDDKTDAFGATGDQFLRGPVKAAAVLAVAPPSNGTQLRVEALTDGRTPSAIRFHAR
jgi:hypothetical protein